MSQRIGEYEWARTPLGPIEEWPGPLKTAVDIALDSAFATFVWWGEHLTHLYNDACIPILRTRHPWALGRPARLVWTDAWPVVGAMLEGVIATGTAVSHADLPVKLDRPAVDRPAYFTFSYSALRDEDGRVAGIYITAIETTKRVETEQALRESQGQFRDIYEHAATGIVITRPDGTLERCNPAYTSMLGYKEQELEKRQPFELVHPDDRDRDEQWHQRLAAGELDRFELDSRYLHRGGRSVWVHKSVALLRDIEGRPERIVTLVTDVTERVRQEEHVQFLLREVNHRSKNVLAVVQSLARQTTGDDHEDFLARLDNRIAALIVAQDLLTESEWLGVQLAELVGTLLDHFNREGNACIDIEGPTLALAPSACQPLSMALNELATNASKYGALSSASGKVSFSWHVVGDDAGGAGAMLEMTWIESGGPPVRQPTRLGLGTSLTGELLESSLRGHVDVDYAPTGLQWRFRCPMDLSVIPPAEATVAPEPAVPVAPSVPRVLVVEDEPVIARYLASVIEREGMEAVGPATSVARGMELLETRGCDAALLDINLAGETSEPLARELRRRSIPILVLTGYAYGQQPAAFRDLPRLNKPVQRAQLIAAIRDLLDG